jgi:hypothetical protein
MRGGLPCARPAGSRNHASPTTALPYLFHSRSTSATISTTTTTPTRTRAVGKALVFPDCVHLFLRPPSIPGQEPEVRACAGLFCVLSMLLVRDEASYARIAGRSRLPGMVRRHSRDAVPPFMTAIVTATSPTEPCSSLPRCCHLRSVDKRVGRAKHDHLGPARIARGRCRWWRDRCAQDAPNNPKYRHVMSSK